MPLSHSPENSRFDNQYQQQLFEKLDAVSFAELERLVSESEGSIGWRKLCNKGVCEIDGKTLTGIFWPENLYLCTTKIHTLGMIKKVQGDLQCDDVKTLKDLGALEYVTGRVELTGTSVKSLGKLKKVGKSLVCRYLKTLKDIGVLEYVGIDADFSGTSVKSLGKLKKVGGELRCKNVSTLQNMGLLEHVSGDVVLIGTGVEAQKHCIAKMNQQQLIVIGTIIFGIDEGDATPLFEEYITVGSSVYGIRCDLRSLKVESLGKWEQVMGSLNCEKNKTLKDLGSLREVGGGVRRGDLNLKGTNVESLSHLEIVHGHLECKYLKTLKDMGALKYVSGNLTLYGTSKEVQKECIRRIHSESLFVKGEILFGGNVDGIEELLEYEKIPGTLDLRGAMLPFQIQAYIYGHRADTITGDLHLDDVVKKTIDPIIIGDGIDRDEFQKRYGSSVDQIHESELRDEAEMIISTVIQRAKKKYKTQIAHEIASRKTSGALKEVDVNTQKEVQERMTRYQSEYESILNQCQKYGREGGIDSI